MSVYPLEDFSEPDDWNRRLKEDDPLALEGFVVFYTPIFKKWIKDSLKRRQVGADQWWDSPSDVLQSV